jgi:toxin CcdB
MMQHDLFANPSRASRAAYPLFVLLQAQAVEGQTRVVAPLIPITAGFLTSRTLPVVDHEGVRYAVVLELVTNLPTRLLRNPVGSIAQHRDDLTRALDWLFWGI